MSEQASPRDPKPAPAGERIAKVLSRAGVASRREAERLIEAGEVRVNGKVITSPALNVTPKDRITVSGEPLAERQPVRLWLYYKPTGLVTSASDEKGRPTVFDHLPEDMPRVMSIGRLDLNSEGLLLLTNDGELKRRLELPATGWLRKYRVRINGRPEDTAFDPLRRGIEVEGERFQPMNVVLDRQQGANAWLTIGLREGKNREIRRAMAAIGFTVNRLIRVSYGPFRLNELQPGQVEELRPRVLRDQLGFDPETGLADEPPAWAKAAPKPGRKPGARMAGGPGGAARMPGGKPGFGKPTPGDEGQRPARAGMAGKPGAAKPGHKPGFAKATPGDEGQRPPRPGAGPGRAGMIGKAGAGKMGAGSAGAGKTGPAKPGPAGGAGRPARHGGGAGGGAGGRGQGGAGAGAPGGPRRPRGGPARD